MYYNRIIKIVKKELREYTLFSKQIEELELYKIKGTESDINSSIQSKNSISSPTENRAIKNLIIDGRIDNIIRWKKIIDLVFENVKKNDERKYEVITYKFIAHLSENEIGTRLHIARNSIRRYLEEFIIEISYLAINDGLIKLEKI